MLFTTFWLNLEFKYLLQNLLSREENYGLNLQTFCKISSEVNAN